MLGHIAEKLHELFLIHGLLLVVVLLHESDKDLFVLELGLTLRVDWIVQRADHFCEQFYRDCVIEMVVEGQRSENLFGGQLFTIHCYYFIGKNAKRSLFDDSIKNQTLAYSPQNPFFQIDQSPLKPFIRKFQDNKLIIIQMDSLETIQREIIDSPQGVDISFKNISYSVEVKAKEGSFLPCMAKKTLKPILKNVSGIFKAGEVTAIMGASGAGKTTLLNVLACRVSLQHQEGEILANNTIYDYEVFGDFANYVMQTDVLMQTLTVRETLKFAADLKLNESSELKEEKMQQLAKSLKLDNCLDTLVGGMLIKGISGGEKKRTSIAFELISNPQVIMLDEPTSGLDSLTSFIIVKYLGDLAKTQNKTVIMTIHQPNSEIFRLFAKLVLIVEGKIIYQGAASSATDYFHSNFNLTCPEFHNPADFFMSVIHHQDPENFKRYPEYIEAYQKNFGKAIEEAIEGREKSEIVKRAVDVPCTTSFKVLVQRDVKNIIRNPMMIKSRLFQTIILFIYVSGLYCKFKQDYTNKINWSSLTGFFFFLALNGVFIAMVPVTLVFPKDRDVFLKEEGAKLYGVTAYFLSRNTVEIPYAFIFPIIQSLIVYWFVGLSSTPEQFFTFYLIVFLTNFSGMSMGLLLGSLVKQARTVSTLSTALLLPFALFSGFFKNQNNLSSWVSWIQYISPFKYGFSAFTQNQVLYKTSLVSQLNLDVSLWGSVACLTALGVGFRLASLFFLWRFRTKLQ